VTEAYRNVRNLSLIIQPGDSFFPIVDAIDAAASTINMTIFRMDDPIVRDAMIHAVGRGVKVQALIAPAAKGWSKRNKKLSEDLARMGIEVRTPQSPKAKIKLYHYKMMTIDDAQALILTFNPTLKNLHYARDFGVLVRDREIATELNRLFDADWQGKNFKPNDLPLVISPYNSRQKLMAFLDSAEHTIRIMDGKVQDPEMISLLLRKAGSGCDVKILSRETHFHGVVPNFHIRRLARYKLHAKCVAIDGARFFVGSQNLRKVSLDQRREVGIMIEDSPMARKIERVFEEDWSNAIDARTLNDSNAV